VVEASKAENTQNGRMGRKKEAFSRNEKKGMNESKNPEEEGESP